MRPTFLVVRDSNIQIEAWNGEALSQVASGKAQCKQSEEQKQRAWGKNMPEKFKDGKESMEWSEWGQSSGRWGHRGEGSRHTGNLQGLQSFHSKLRWGPLGGAAETKATIWLRV